MTMKVKIGNKIYSSSDEPIMLILDDNDKKLISEMHKDAHKFCVYPDTWDSKDIKEWMQNVNDKENIQASQEDAVTPSPIEITSLPSQIPPSPPQCTARREPTKKERLVTILGLFNIREETRCHLYEGHHNHGYLNHRDLKGNEW